MPDQTAGQGTSGAGQGDAGQGTAGAGTGGSGGGTQAGNQGGGTGTGRVEFSPEQLSRVQALVDQSVAAADARWATRLTELEKRIPKAADDKSKGGDDKSKSGDGKQSTPDAREEEFRRALDQAKTEAAAASSKLEEQLKGERRERLRSIVLAAVAPLAAEGVADLVANHLIEHVGADDAGRVVVRGEKGAARIGKTGELMTVDDLAREFLAAHKALARPAMPGSGGGSHGGGSGNALLDQITADPSMLMDPKRLPTEEFRKIAGNFSVPASVFSPRATGQIRVSTGANPYEGRRDEILYGPPTAKGR